jgi:hypothetical protein
MIVDEILYIVHDLSVAAVGRGGHLSKGIIAITVSGSRLGM